MQVEMIDLGPRQMRVAEITGKCRQWLALTNITAPAHHGRTVTFSFGEQDYEVQFTETQKAREFFTELMGNIAALPL